MIHDLRGQGCANPELPGEARPCPPAPRSEGADLVCNSQGDLRPPSSPSISRSRRWFQVIRIHATTMATSVTSDARRVSIVAKVVEIEPFGDRAVLPFVEHSMRWGLPSLRGLNASVSALVQAVLPLPAVGLRIDDVLNRRQCERVVTLDKAETLSLDIPLASFGGYARRFSAPAFTQLLWRVSDRSRWPNDMHGGEIVGINRPDEALALVALTIWLAASGVVAVLWSRFKKVVGAD